MAVLPASAGVICSCEVRLLSEPLVRLVRLSTGPQIDPLIRKPSRPVSGDTEFRITTAFVAPRGGAEAGVWESTAGVFRSDTTGYIEFGHIVEGEARIVDPDGTVHALKAGDPFVMPEGFKGHWEVDHFVKKVFFVSPVAAEG